MAIGALIGIYSGLHRQVFVSSPFPWTAESRAPKTRHRLIHRVQIDIEMLGILELVCVAVHSLIPFASHNLEAADNGSGWEFAWIGLSLPPGRRIVGWLKRGVNVDRTKMLIGLDRYSNFLIPRKINST
jgi:hypothetical protein